MPKFLERRLRASAKAAGKTGKAADRYVFGAMNNMGAMRGSKTTAKGKAMERKHERTLAASGTSSTGGSYDFRKQRGRRAPAKMHSA